MKAAIRFVSFLILSSVLGVSMGADAMRPEAGIDVMRAIAIADGALGDHGRPADLELVTAKLYWTTTNEITKARTAGADDLTRKLSGKTYWMIYYRSRTSDLGGDVGVFVDASDSRVIHIYRGR
jgi:hypothetical protein